MKKNIAIIGGTGFIGRRFIEFFHESFGIVICLCKDAEKFKELNFGKNVIYLNNNLSEEAFISEFERYRINYLLDLSYATVPKTSFEDPLHDISSNLFSTVNTFEWAKKVKLEKMVWFSTGGAIYGHTDELIINENHAVNPISPYGITKLALEKYAYMYFKLFDLPIICLRPSNAFGPTQVPFRGQGFISTSIVSILQDKPINLFGKNGTVRDYIYIDDLCQAIIAAFAAGKPGEVYNIGTGNGINNIEIIEHISAFAIEIGKKPQVIIQESRPFDVKYNVLNFSKFKKDTSWSPQVQFKDAIRITWDWYYNNYK